MKPQVSGLSYCKFITGHKRMAGNAAKRPITGSVSKTNKRKGASK